MAAWPSGISTVTLFVEDLDAAKEFYGRVFGLPVVFEDPDSAVYRFGSMLVNLLKTSAAGELVDTEARTTAAVAVGKSTTAP